MHAIIETDDTDAVLLIDASNAFNALNRAATLHNICVLCPVIAAYAINTYSHQLGYLSLAAKRSCQQKTKTQGVTLGMGLYALSIQPLITSLQEASRVKR